MEYFLGVHLLKKLKNAEIIEYIAELCFISKNINPKAETIESYISSKHFDRKAWSKQILWTID